VRDEPFTVKKPTAGLPQKKTNATNLLAPKHRLPVNASFFFEDG